MRERATALEEADRVKTDFVANMSYELRTPLTSIGGFAEMLAAGYAGKLPPAAADYVGAILESVDRLSKLIDDVLDLTQGDTQRRSAGARAGRHRRPVPGGAAKRCGRAPTRKGRSSRSGHRCHRPAVVIGDARRLRESIEHVLRNAVAYTDDGGRISLKAKGDDDNAMITITDNGPGIAAEDQPQVFTRFHRVGDAGAAAKRRLASACR